MLRYEIKCDNKPTRVDLKVAVLRPTKVIIKVVNPSKPNTVYLDRYQTVQKEGEFEIRLPQNCEKAILMIGTEDGNDQGIRIRRLRKTRLSQHKPCLSSGYRASSFMKFAQDFSENAGVLSTGTYKSDDGKFTIQLIPQGQITENGKAVPTPARIHNETGVIQVSKEAFTGMTVPMRVGILCHEYSHFYKNQKQTDEIEADLNGLAMYLGMGYPVIEAHKSFLGVFKESPSDENKERYEYIKTLIDHWDDHKYKICLP